MGSILGSPYFGNNQRCMEGIKVHRIMAEKIEQNCVALNLCEISGWQVCSTEAVRVFGMAIDILREAEHCTSLIPLLHIWPLEIAKPSRVILHTINANLGACVWVQTHWVCYPPGVHRSYVDKTLSAHAMQKSGLQIVKTAGLHQPSQHPQPFAAESFRLNPEVLADAVFWYRPWMPLAQQLLTKNTVIGCP